MTFAINSIWPRRGGGPIHFLPHKVILFAEKKVRRKYQNFIRGTLTGQTPLLQTKVLKVKHFLEGSWHTNFMNT